MKPRVALDVRDLVVKIRFLFSPFENFLFKNLSVAVPWAVEGGEVGKVDF